MELSSDIKKDSIQQFETGATRNKDDHKFDYEGFLSPFALERFGRYMHEHRKQKDGTIRDSDNWQKGIPLPRYMKSLLRHVFEVWTIHRGGTAINPDTEEPFTMDEALCGVFFNAMGMLHELMKEKK